MLSKSSQAQRDGDPSSAGAAVQLAGLGNQFLGLLGRKWSRRAFAAEMAKLLAGAAGVRAAAVLGYERRSGSLVLLADYRLPEDARAALSSGAEGAWDIPLRGLQNRRISVIEAAHQNPFVPRALTQFCPAALCIVSLPVYYDYEPVGVVLLFAARSRAFPDGQLQTLSQALRVCGRGLRERESPIARISTAAAAPAVSPAGATPEAAHREEPTLRLLGGGQVEAIQERQPEAAVTEAQRVQQELARAQAEMQRRSEAVRSVATATRALRTERDRLAQQLTELEYLRKSESDGLRAQIGALEERLLAAESERLRYQRAAEAKHQRTEESVQTLQAERDALLERLRAAESSGSEVQTILNAARQERDQLAAQRQGELQEAAATAAQLRQQLQDGAAALTASDEQLAAFKAQLERAGIERQQAERVFEDALASARADIERLTADASSLRAQLEERDADLARLRDDSERAQQAQSTLHQSTAALREDVDRLTAQLEQTATTAAMRESELGAALAQARAEAETLRRASADRETLARAATDLGDRAAGLEQLVASLREQVAQAQAEGARGDQQTADLRAQLAAAQQTYEQARADAEREQTELQAAVKAAQTAAQSATAETEELRHTVHDALQRLEEERLKHAAEIEALLEESALPLSGAAAEAPTAMPEEAEGEEEFEAPEGPLVIERSAPLAAAAETLAEPAESPEPPMEYPSTAASAEELVLLDQGATAEQACAALAGAGFQVTSFPFGENTVDELARRKLKCIMLNLAGGAAAWRTLRLLRERVATRNVPILVYVMAPDATTGFCFGRTDFALWPLESGRMIEHLGRLRPKLHRLLAVTSDVEGMGQLREPLARAKISTSIVLDAKQVIDFAAMIDPEAAILHISPSCPSAARALQALRANDSTRELPLLVLLDKSAGDDEPFFSQASKQLLSKARFQFSRLPEEIGRLIG
jgi:DNA-binding response OmpR family regulator